MLDLYIWEVTQQKLDSWVEENVLQEVNGKNTPQNTHLQMKGISPLDKDCPIDPVILHWNREFHRWSKKASRPFLVDSSTGSFNCVYNCIVSGSRSQEKSWFASNLTPAYSSNSSFRANMALAATLEEFQFLHWVRSQICRRYSATNRNKRKPRVKSRICLNQNLHCAAQKGIQVGPA